MEMISVAKKSIKGLFLVGVVSLGIFTYQPNSAVASEATSEFSGGWIEGEGEFGNKPTNANSLVSARSQDFYHKSGNKNVTTRQKTGWAETYWRNVYHYSRVQLKTAVFKDVRVDSGRKYGQAYSYAEATGVRDLVTYTYWGS